jgi:DNA repair exonuclease SbcCD ATPase subunit
MTLDRVRLEGFLSHDLTDWQPDGARLVTLVGPNGAGKSTLASDALSYALFDEARGRTDDLVQLGATNMSVLVEFTFGDARYRVVRGRTTRSGGKSFLELHVADGEGWRPLTGDTIRDTEQLIGELLRLDAATFETAVLLGQGHANRFAEATASERKRILGQVLGLDVYARAEARARELARDLEARTVANRDRLERLDAQLVDRPYVEEHLAVHRAALAESDAQTAIQVAARDELDVRIRAIDAELAAADAIADQVKALEAERTGAGEAWRRAAGRITAATRSIEGAERLLADAATVTEAADSLPAMQAGLETLLETERADRVLAHDIDVKRRELEASTREYSDTLSTHRARYEAARRHVDALAAAAAGTPVACEVCGYEHNAGADPAHLAAARVAFRELEGAEPKPPAGLAREQAALARLEARRREAGFDPERMVKLQADVRQVAATAARSEGMAAARATLERERATIAEAEAEKAQVAARGQALAERIAELTVTLAGSEPLRAERVQLTGQQTQVRSMIGQLERSRTIGVQLVAREEAALEALDRTQAERDELAGSLEASGVELAHLRRLVTAFGVTGIPARIIESILPELARYANELLAELRPGMTLALRAQRAKKDGSGVVEALDLVVRDDVGERPLAMFSGGERMSVSLALAVALSRLVARRAGTAIRTFVIDEPDGLDAEARRAFGQALRVLAHHGELERVVVVSHHEDLAEIGDAVYRVTKNGRGSVVEQVA